MSDSYDKGLSIYSTLLIITGIIAVFTGAWILPIGVMAVGLIVYYLMVIFGNKK